MVHKNAGITTAVFFSFAGMPVIITAIILIFKYKKIHKKILVLVEFIAAFLYFYGDNINHITLNYGEELGCDSTCRANNRIAAMISLGLSLLIYFLFQPIIKEFAEKLEWDDEKDNGWKYALNMISVVIKIDALYTAIAIMVQTDEFCKRTEMRRTEMRQTEMTLSIIFVTLTCIAGVSSVMAYAKLTLTHDFKHEKEACCKIATAAGMLIPCIITYMLADNSQPLGSAFGCDLQAADDITMNEMSCNVIGNSGLRVGLMSFNVIVVMIIIILFCHGYRKEKDPERNDPV